MDNVLIPPGTVPALLQALKGTGGVGVLVLDEMSSTWTEFINGDLPEAEKGFVFARSLFHLLLHP